MHIILILMFFSDAISLDPAAGMQYSSITNKEDNGLAASRTLIITRAIKKSNQN